MQRHTQNLNPATPPLSYPDLRRRDLNHNINYFPFSEPRFQWEMSSERHAALAHGSSHGCPSIRYPCNPAYTSAIDLSVAPSRENKFEIHPKILSEKVSPRREALEAHTMSPNAVKQPENLIKYPVDNPSLLRTESSEIPESKFKLRIKRTSKGYSITESSSSSTRKICKQNTKSRTLKSNFKTARSKTDSKKQFSKGNAYAKELSKHNDNSLSIIQNNFTEGPAIDPMYALKLISLGIRETVGLHHTGKDENSTVEPKCRNILKSCTENILDEKPSTSYDPNVSACATPKLNINDLPGEQLKSTEIIKGGNFLRDHYDSKRSDKYASLVPNSIDKQMLSKSPLTTLESNFTITKDSNNLPTRNQNGLEKEPSVSSIIKEIPNLFHTSQDNEGLNRQSETERNTSQLSSENNSHGSSLISSSAQDIMASSIPKFTDQSKLCVQDEQLQSTVITGVDGYSHDHSYQCYEKVESSKETTPEDQQNNVKRKAEFNTRLQKKKIKSDLSSSRSSFSCDACGFKTDTSKDFQKHLSSDNHIYTNYLKLNKKHAFQVIALQQARCHPIFKSSLESAHVSESLSQKMKMVIKELFSFSSTCKRSTVEGSSSSDSINFPKSVAALTAENENPLNEVETRSWKLYQCMVCRVFSTNSFEEMVSHFEKDRSKIMNSKIEQLCIPPECELCGYNLEQSENILYHFMDQNHLQKLNIANHILEGGARNEGKLGYVKSDIFEEVCCNACNVVINYKDKLPCHVQDPVHQSNQKHFLKFEQTEYIVDKKSYFCKGCQTSFITNRDFFKHLKSEEHMISNFLRTTKREMDFTAKLSRENSNHNKVITDNLKVNSNEELSVDDSSSQCNQYHEKGNEKENSDGDLERILIARVKENDRDIFICPFCCFKSEGRFLLALHVLRHSKFLSSLNCPLCIIGFNDWTDLKNHIIEFHQVDKEKYDLIIELVKATKESDQVSDTDSECEINVVDDEIIEPTSLKHNPFKDFSENTSANKVENFVHLVGKTDLERDYSSY